MDPALISASRVSPRKSMPAKHELPFCATCKKAINPGSFKNCASCREVNRRKSQLAAQRKRERARRASDVTIFAGLPNSDDSDDTVMMAPPTPNPMRPVTKENKPVMSAALAKKSLTTPLHELEGDEKRVALAQLKNRLNATLAQKGARLAAAHVASTPSKGVDGMQYQTASAMYDALKRRMLGQKKLKFLGYHAIVAVSTISHAQRVQMVANDLRKIARLSFEHTKGLESHDFRTMARTLTFQCTCLGYEQVKPTLMGNAGDLIKMARMASGITTPRICGGKIVVTAGNDETHPLNVLGQRVVVRVHHD